MPFVVRKIEPVYLSRKSLFDDNGKSLVSDFELDAITNNTLSNVLRQLASLVLVANDIFEELAQQLKNVHDRSQKLRITIQNVEDKLALYDPKTVTVPEGDICTFSERKIHFKSSLPTTTSSNLFTKSTRPKALQRLYETAIPTPVPNIRELDRFRRDGIRSSKYFVCTPVFGSKRRKFNKKVDIDIETRKPTVVEELRRWTSTEALGDITVLPDNVSKITTNESTIQDEVDHLLPSPEEQMQALALRFPPSVIVVDVTGKPFNRMHSMRRSLINVELTSDATSRRRTKNRKHRGKRRNTIAGTSEKEIQQAIAGETTTELEEDNIDMDLMKGLLSRSSDLLKPNNKPISENLKNRLNTLKNWSRSKLKLSKTCPEGWTSSRPSFQATDVVDDINIYETVSSKRRRSERSITVTNTAAAISLAVKLRENSLQRRNRRAGANKGKDEPPHSSSGNWSASSESGRASVASETTAPPKSSTTTSNNSLNNHHHYGVPSSGQSRRRYFPGTSNSSSISEGTLTPDINDLQNHEMDGETSSVYSCDTEGYYTSFHLDSGLKTLKEEEIALSVSSLQLPEQAMQSTTALSSSSGRGSQMTAENEYELFGKGSTSTTTSSAGTVCTTLPAGYGSTRSLSQYAPLVPERKSSLERMQDKKMLNDRRMIKEDNSSATVVAMIHDSPSPDSGHNTSSSPVEDNHSPHDQSELESDLEGCERIERIRSKTAMTSCRIPSLCVITPPVSDDELSLRNYNNVVPLKNVPFLKNYPEQRHKPLNIVIPTVPTRNITDIYAQPDKTKKINARKGILETNLDDVKLYATTVPNSKVSDIKQLTLEKSDFKNEYISLDELAMPKHDDSLERKKRGAKVTLDPQGKVIYSSDSLKRKKQHSTFEPGKFVRDSPTPSPLPDHRTKAIRPINLTGLLRRNKPKEERASPQLGKVIIRANAKAESPTKDFVRMPASRVVSPSSVRAISPKRGARVHIGREQSQSPQRFDSPISSASSTLDRKRCTSPASSSSSNEQKRSSSPASSGSSKEDKPKTLWISEHPSVSNGFLRNDMYRSLPMKTDPAKYGIGTTIKNASPHSSQKNGAIDPYCGLTSAKLVRQIERNNLEKQSTPTRSNDHLNLSNVISPITPLLSPPKSKMTSEEIFAAIHKSKKRLQLTNSPLASPDEKQKRNSWSPQSDEDKTIKPTPIHEFKKLLLQQGAKSSPIPKSAVEQLRISKQVYENKRDFKNPRIIGLKNPKNNWKFSSPRSNILSSTIPEDCDEVEKPEEVLKYKKELEKSNPLLTKSPSDVSRFQKFLDKSSNAIRQVNLPRKHPEIATTERESKVQSMAVSTRNALKIARLNFFNQSSTGNVKNTQENSSPPSQIENSPMHQSRFSTIRDLQEPSRTTIPKIILTKSSNSPQKTSNYKQNNCIQTPAYLNQRDKLVNSATNGHVNYATNGLRSPNSVSFSALSQNQYYNDMNRPSNNKIKHTVISRETAL